MKASGQKAACLQDRDDVTYEVVKRVRQKGRRNHEPISRTALHDRDELLGDFVRCSDGSRTHDAGSVDAPCLADRHRAIACDAAQGSEISLAARNGNLIHGCVEGQITEVGIRVGRQCRKTYARTNKAVVKVALGFGLGAPNDRERVSNAA